MTDQLLRFNKKQKYLLFDEETFNLSLTGYNNNYPWQLAFRTFDLYNNYEEKDIYINWNQVPIKEIQEMTNYSHERMEMEGQDPQQIYDFFIEYINNPEYIIVGHNILGFDIPVLRNWGQKVGRKTDFKYLNRVIDTLCLAKAYRFDHKVDRENFYLWQVKMSKVFARAMKCKLSDLAKEFDIDFDPDLCHNAAFDVALNEKVFKQLIWRLEI